jgi:glutathione peroxidase
LAGSVFDFILTTLRGEEFPLADLKGRPLLIVNTASKCGFTPQYAGLQALSVKWGKLDGGLVVIGVPSNDFGNQEPGEAEAIGEFCEHNYGVTFPVMAKAHVRGQDADPLFRWLGQESGFLGKPRWNFYKYLIGRDGQLVKWFPCTTAPNSAKLDRAIEAVM